MGPRAGLDRCGKSRPTGIRSPDRSARSQSLYQLSYPANSVTQWHLYELMCSLLERAEFKIKRKFAGSVLVLYKLPF